MAAAESLSPREMEIAQGYADGETYHVIANRLCIAPSTVRTHIATIYRKLEVSSKLALRDVIQGGKTKADVRTDHAAVISELALNLEEALSREKAMAEVLRIISRSRGNIEDVLRSILAYALELCDAEFGILFEYHQRARFSASFARGIPAAFQQWLAEQGTFTVSPQTGLGRMEAARETINIFDVRSEDIYRSDNPLRYATAVLGGARSFVAIPMLAGDRLVGAFTIYRQQVRPFGAETTMLAQTFADQSAIAIENARMISELRSAPPIRTQK